MEKILEDELERRKNSRKITKNIITLFIGLIILIAIPLLQQLSEYSFLNHVQNLTRTVVLKNGMQFTMKPKYRDYELCIHLTVKNGFARLNNDESFDLHLVDEDGFDIVNLPFYNKDFADTGNSFDAYKCTMATKAQLLEGRKIRMYYPSWVADK